MSYAPSDKELAVLRMEAKHTKDFLPLVVALERRVEAETVAHKCYKAEVDDQQAQLAAANAIIEKLATAYLGWMAARAEFRNSFPEAVDDHVAVMQACGDVSDWHDQIIAAAAKAAQETP